MALWRDVPPQRLRQEPGLRENGRALLLFSRGPSSGTVILPTGFRVLPTCGPDGGTLRSILLGFGTRHLSRLVCIRLPEPRLLPQPRAVRLVKNNLEEGESRQRRLGSSRSCSGLRA